MEYFDLKDSKYPEVYETGSPEDKYYKSQEILIVCEYGGFKKLFVGFYETGYTDGKIWRQWFCPNIQDCLNNFGVVKGWFPLSKDVLNKLI